MVSVVIPAFNAEAWIDDCLRSVEAQGIDGLEIIVVDDGSTDSTASRASAHAGVRMISTSNCGLACARNVGIEAATQPYICFVDADDRLLPDALSTMLSLARHNGNTRGADVVFGGVARKEFAAVHRSFNSRTLDARQALLALLYQNIPHFGSVWASLFPTALVRSVMFTPGIYYEDLDFSFRLYLSLAQTSPNNFRLCVVDRPVYFYRPNPSSFINTFSAKRLDVLRVTENMERLTADSPEFLEAARSRRLSACFNIYLILRRNGLYPDVMRRCRDEIVRLRASMLRNPRVRLKNKLGILLSYLAGAVGLF